MRSKSIILCIVVVPAVPMMLLKGGVLDEGVRNRCSEEWRRLQKPKRASSTRANRTGNSHQASEQRTKTASAQGAGGASLFARRLVDLTRKSEFEAT
ncbi:hypothetical protein M431DRAFT_458252 [Trichoderma harzianum CBS 226.95]|uniref:Secreted protein n=1 Tax=Trichoderma harzianum CBS 226.95 TaxID=983964 RepID=A0A2T4A7X2_TRIHA|nr:hypothetical protein M431DRAFT_458252 [Trichoderma harzianum CBS 226.95]PTB53151.1 hypothetical protein M431DRAFT_458252 [Trichoderma harzianum CBS 226.95]